MIISPTDFCDAFLSVCKILRDLLKPLLEILWSTAKLCLDLLIPPILIILEPIYDAFCSLSPAEQNQVLNQLNHLPTETWLQYRLSDTFLPEEEIMIMLPEGRLLL